jgi:hypothetical protein
MKKGTEKYIATSTNFTNLQLLRGCIKDDFNAQNVNWSGYWDGIKYEYFSFYSTTQELENIKTFCKINELNINVIKN